MDEQQQGGDRRGAAGGSHFKDDLRTHRELRAGMPATPATEQC